MHMADTREIAASPSDVWKALLDPEVLKQCIPGCESMTGTAEQGFEAAVVQKVGPVKARFTGLVTLSDLQPGQSVRISGEGKGGPAGFAKGGATVTLEPAGTGTRLNYDVNANVGGKIAQLGSRIIDGFAKKMADEFFTRFKTTVEGPAPDLAEAGEGEGAEDAAGPAKKSWFKRMIGG